MKILALGRDLEGTDEQEFNPHLVAEAKKVWELFKGGILREVYFRAESPDAVLVLECENSAIARDILAELPLVQNGLIDFEIIPLMPYPGFERLFKTDVLKE